MIVTAEYIDKIYDEIKREKTASSDKGVLIFASGNHADSVCAAQQLLSLFKREEVFNTLYPVNSYDEIRELCASESVCQTDDTEDSPRTIIMLNCGATENVRLRCDITERARIVIIDSHRPIWHGHLGDANDERNVMDLVVMDADDPVSQSAIPPFLANESQAGDEDTYDSDDDEDEQTGDEDEEAGSDDGGSRQRPVGSKRPRQQQQQSGGSQGQDDSQGGGEGRQGRRAVRKFPVSPERRLLLDSYYSNHSGYGKPASLLVYELCQQMKMADNTFLWCAIVGLTEQYIHQQVSKFDYERWRAQLETHVRNSNEDDDAEMDFGPTNGNLNSVCHDRPHIRPVVDFRFTLLRHWSLSAAMRFSNHMGARMQTWRDKGLTNMYNFLAFMLIPVKQADVAYCNMRVIHKQRLRTQLSVVAPNHSLIAEQLLLDSFEMRYKQEVQISASDAAYALTAMLSTPLQSNPPRSARENFNDACQMLHISTEYSKFMEGVEKAKSLAKSIILIGGLLLTKNTVKAGKNKDYFIANLANEEGSDVGQFVHPLALSRLAIFLRDAQGLRLKGGTRPIIAVGPPNSEGNCYLVGIRASHQRTGMQASPFCTPFMDTLNSLNGRRSSVSFDNSLFLLPKADVPSFVDQLCRILAAYQKQ